MVLEDEEGRRLTFFYSFCSFVLKTFNTSIYCERKKKKTSFQKEFGGTILKATAMYVFK